MHVLYCDASTSLIGRVSGIAVTGDLGDHARVVRIADSLNAEIAAVAMAAGLAGHLRDEEVLILTDCEAIHTRSRRAAISLLDGLPDGWDVAIVPGALTTRAHLLANEARRRGLEMDS
jgi:hypothetical protein